MPDTASSGTVVITRPEPLDSFASSIEAIRTMAQDTASAVAGRSEVGHSHGALATNEGLAQFQDDLILNLISTPGIYL